MHSERTIPDRKPLPHWYATVVVSLLPLSYVPPEIIRTDFRVTYLTISLVLFAGIRYRLVNGSLYRLEILAGALAVWAVARLLVIAPLGGEPPDIGGSAREILTISAGVVLFRIASDPELRPAVVRGLGIGIVLMLLVEVYQLSVGLNALLSAGYDAPDFNFNTADGDFRPFGTLQSPVTFGIYLAVTGLAFALSSGRRWAVPIGLATAAGLALTDTRSAWIAFVVGLGVALALQPRPGRSRKLLLIVPVVWAIAVAALVNPGLFSGFVARLGTITDAEDTSTSIRVVLWEGTARAFVDRPLDGFGSTDFAVVLRPLIGTIAEFGHPHNTYLQLLYLYGAVGLILFVALMVTLLLHGSGRASDGAPSPYRPAAAAALVAFAIGALFESMWTSFTVLATVFLVAGLATGTAAVRRPEPVAGRDSPPVGPGTGSD